MTGFEIIILIGLVVGMAAGIGYYMTKDHPSLKEMTEEPKEKFQPRKVIQKTATRQLTESAQELVKEIEKVSKVPTTQEESQQLAKDLVNIVTKEKKTKSEFPIDKPKKKRKYYPKKK
jgi:broad-specificity NMP kinase